MGWGAFGLPLLREICPWTRLLPFHWKQRINRKKGKKNGGGAAVEKWVSDGFRNRISNSSFSQRKCDSAAVDRKRAKYVETS